MAGGTVEQDSRQPLGVYIHVPFCRVHCPYCDFYTYPSVRRRAAEYVAALEREIGLWPGRLDPQRFEVETVYFGGGTPSMLTLSQLRQILTSLRNRLKIRGAAEITLEANPEDVTKESIAAWVDLGINRVSLGVQTLEAERLAFLGRVHSVETAVSALELLSLLPNWSADLMFGWEGQTVRQLEQELERLLSFSPTHVSLYQLTLEPKTRFGVLAAKGLVRCADPDSQAQLYLAACERLESRGLLQYEVSNFAQPGHESRHNAGYWVHRAYVGLGPSAASLLGLRRTRNAASLPRYLEKLRSGFCPVEFVEVLSPQTVALERLWLGLRTRSGVPRDWLRPESQLIVERAQADGLLTTGHCGRIALTRKGMAVADEVLTRLLPTDIDRILTQGI